MGQLKSDPVVKNTFLRSMVRGGFAAQNRAIGLGRTSKGSPIPGMGSGSEVSPDTIDAINEQLKSYPGLEAKQPSPLTFLPEGGFFGRHPKIGQAIEGALMGAAFTSSSRTIGEGISNVAKGVIESQQFRRQSQMQRAMAPLGIAERLEKLKETQALTEQHKAMAGWYDQRGDTEAAKAQARAPKPFPEGGGAYMYDEATGTMLPKTYEQMGIMGITPKSKDPVLDHILKLKAGELQRPLTSEEETELVKDYKAREGNQVIYHYKDLHNQARAALGQPAMNPAEEEDYMTRKQKELASAPQIAGAGFRNQLPISAADQQKYREIEGVRTFEENYKAVEGARNKDLFTRGTTAKQLGYANVGEYDNMLQQHAGNIIKHRGAFVAAINGKDEAGAPIAPFEGTATNYMQGRLPLTIPRKENSPYNTPQARPSNTPGAAPPPTPQVDPTNPGGYRPPR